MSRSMYSFALGLCVLLGGCSLETLPVSSDLSQAKDTAKTIELARGIYLNLEKFWPLSENRGVYLQQVKASVAGHEHTLTVHISQTPEKLEFIAFNDIIGRLYALTWTQDKTTWDASEAVPPTMVPENIIGDFLLVHLDLKQLNQCLIGAQAIDAGDVRTIQSVQYGIIRKVTRHNYQNSIWQHSIIENPQLGYHLEIETVIAP